MHIITSINQDKNGEFSIEVLDYGTMVKTTYTVSELQNLIKNLSLAKKLLQGAGYKTSYTNENKLDSVTITSLTSYDITEHLSYSEMQEYIRDENISKGNLTTLYINNMYITLEKIKEVKLQ